MNRITEVGVWVNGEWKCQKLDIRIFWFTSWKRITKKINKILKNLMDESLNNQTNNSPD